MFGLAKIDGKGDDWGDKGFKVGALCDVAGKTRTPENFNTSFALGWDERGLLVPEMGGLCCYPLRVESKRTCASRGVRQTR